MNRCFWVNKKNPLYVKYHDEEWGVPSFDDDYLFEMLVLESFQAGLSWECILNKREAFREAFNHFNKEKIASYNEEKVEELLQNTGIVRNRRKILATIQNAKIFMSIQQEFGSFSNYIWSFSKGKITKRKTKKNIVSNSLSDKISKDLMKRGMHFVGTTIIYSYLQAIGIINDHDLDCDWYKKGENI
ncbi:MAG: DNA-3-methyladenine glycosylase I [Bacilli bacterium]|nr:DNA-3-methyladenine glycosylase I [Bacilli bacterium]